MTMAERVNHPAHYNAGGIECIDALEAATIGLEGIEAFCTANAIKYLWRWKRKNGEEDLQKAIWYINRIIDRAGEPPEERKGLFNMTENKHGFMPKQEITIGGIAFTIIQTAESWVKCIASECIGNGAFDAKNRNDFAASDIREFLNGEFLQKLIGAGAPEAMFEYFNVDLTADDGLKDYGGDCVRVGLITCDEYRLFAATFRSFRTLGGGRLHRTARKTLSSAASIPTARCTAATLAAGAGAFARFAF